MNRKELLEKIQKELTTCLPEDKKYGLYIGNLIELGGKTCTINIKKLED